MSPLRGIVLKLLSVCAFVAMSSLIKAVRDTVPAGETVFFRAFFALPVILGWLAWRGELATGFRTSNPMGHLWRGLVGTTAMGCGFAALGYLPFPEVTAIGYAAPLLVVIFAAMFLGEQVRLVRLSAVAMGIVGVLIVLSPRLSIGPEGVGTAETLGALLALMGAVFAALAQVFVRRLVQTESTATIVFYFSIIAALLGLATLPWGWVVPTPLQAGALIVAGLLGGVGQILLTSSYRLADASLIAPFDYASMLLAIIVGLAFFGEIPSPSTLSGAAIIIAAGVLIIWRERQLGLAREAQRKITGKTGV